MEPQRKPIRIALLFEMDAKVNRDRFSGVLRFSAKRELWEVRNYTLSNIATVFATPPGDRKAFWLPDGMIQVGDHPMYSRFRSSCERLAKRHIPCVCIDGGTRTKRLKSNGDILTDDQAIGNAAADFFIRKGFANFAFVGTQDASEREHSDARFKAFRDGLLKAGFGCTAIPGMSKDTRQPVPVSRLADLLTEIEMPCAVFAYSDEIARTVLDACHFAGIAVPMQLSVLGVDDQTEITENTNPALSSILPDFERSGFQAAELLAAILGGDLNPKRIISSRIIGISERASTQDVRGSGRIVRIALEYIRLHLSEPLHAKDISKALNLSTRLLEMRFRETLGCTILEKITSLRLEKAVHLLRKTDMPFAQISFACGYATPDGLKLAFRKRFGLSMSQWKSAQGNRSDD